MNRPALLGGTPIAGPDAWPAWPQWDDRERRALLAVLDSGRWQSGPQVEAFEREFAGYQGASQCVAVTNGTSSMELALRAAGIGPGDEVIVPSYTFVATALAPLALGAVPVLVDNEPESLNIDPERVRAAITDRTRAIVPVHVGGRPADLDALEAIASESGLFVLEDAAHAHGAEWRQRRIGSGNSVASFSFQTGKSITAGDGGCLVTGDDEAAANLRSLRNFGRDPGGETARIGGNFRMTEFQAAVLRCQLGRLDEQIVARERNVGRLARLLEGIPGVRLAAADPRVTREPYYQVVLLLDEERFGLRKARLLEAMAAEGVPLEGGYAPLHRLPYLARERSAGRVRIDDCPNSERAADGSVLWLSFRMALAGPGQIDKVAEALARIRHHAEELR